MAENQGNISQWVSRVQQQHSGAGGAAGATLPSPVAGAAHSADALEDEVRRARKERMRRRGHLTSGTSAAGDAPKLAQSTLSGEDTLKKLLAERGLPSPTPPSATDDAQPDWNAGAMRTNALLDRYGGASGPTGVARPGTHESPVSLASFMGGKAAGPRLGKLAGDGRSAPPEAAMVHESRNALPGLARPTQSPADSQSASTPLASFLEARAGGRTSPSRLGFSPPKRSYSPPKLQDRTLNVQTNLPEPARQSFHHPVKRDVATSPFKSPDFKPSGTPFNAPSNVSSRTSTALSPGSIVHSPTADAIARFPDVTPSGQNRSPLPSPNLPQEEQGLSQAFLATQQSTDRLPTASLTRLRSKKMVEQREKEAQERGTSQDPSLPAPKRSPQLGAGTDARQIWATPEPERSSRALPAGLSNALPGLSGQQGGSYGAPRNLYAVNRKTPEEESAAYAPPVRLPGMGGAISPFASRQNTEEETQHSATLEPLAKGRVKPKRAVPSSASSNTMNAVRDAPEMTSEVPHIGRQAYSSARSAFEGVSATSPYSQTAPNVSVSIDVQDAKRATARQQSAGSGPDSAARIEDNTAALEALLEGRKVHTPPPHASSIPAENLQQRKGTLKIAKNRDQSIQLDHSALSDTSAARKDAALFQSRKTVALDVMLVDESGSTSSLSGDDDEAATLYETETQVIVHRYKDTATSAIVTTRVYARVGRLSSVVLGQNSAEARKAMEIAQAHRVPLIDARQGRESIELAQLLGGCLITREGNRQDATTGTRCMFQIREMQRTLFIDQVDMLTASLSSAFTVVVTPGNGSAIVWQGKGVTKVMRQAGLQFAETLVGSSRAVSELEEGIENGAFRTLFEREVKYSDAWHHRLLPTLSQDLPHVRLFGIQDAPRSTTKKLIEQRPFSAIDIRRDGVYLLQLPFELYVLVGPEARSHRQPITAMLDAGAALSRHLSNLRGPHVMTAPVHVIVFPSLVPREVRTAFRYWHDEHLNGKRWQRMQLRMNVWERKQALQQMQRNEYSLAELDDDLFLPVGVGLDDVKDLDI